MSFFTPEQVRSAVAQHDTVFFDCDLNPVTPEVGDWYCEFEIVETYEGEDIRDAALVRYEGKGDRVTLEDHQWVTVLRDMVLPEYADEWREPSGCVLIRQS